MPVLSRVREKRIFSQFIGGVHDRQILYRQNDLKFSSIFLGKKHIFWIFAMASDILVLVLLLRFVLTVWTLILVVLVVVLVLLGVVLMKIAVVASHYCY